jgi:hypothetical protein
MNNQISVPQYSDDPEVQAAYAAAFQQAYDESFAIGHAEGLREGHAAAFAEGERLGEIEQRERCAAILGSPVARGRETSARHFAFSTNLTAEEAIGALATVPKDTAGASSVGERQKGTVVSGPWVA